MTEASLTQTASGAVSNSAALFPLVAGTKRPAVEGWQHTKPGDYQATGQDGLNLGADDLVIDCDPRNYPDERNITEEIWALTISKAPTKIVQTCNGGYHLYYKKPHDVEIKKKQTAWPGVDFLSAGCFVVVEGSKVEGSKTSNGIYSIYHRSPVALIPQEFLDSLERSTKPSGLAIKQDGFIDDSPWNQDRFISCLNATEPAVEGSNGDDRTLLVAYRGRDLGLTEATCFELMAQHYNPRCTPPWSESDLRSKVHNAYRYAQNKQGSKNEKVILAAFATESRPTALPTIELPKEFFPRNHAGNAMRLARMFGHCMRWFKAKKDWLVWDGKRWRVDNKELPKAYAMEVVKALFEVAATDEERKFAATSGAASAINGMLELARPYLAITEESLDQDPYLLNCNNGTVDLKTGELRGHHQEDYITKFIDIDYEPRAAAQRWEQFLNEIFAGSQSLIDFVQRAAGSATSGCGCATHQKLFIAHGGGQNGKSTFFNMLHAVLGDYAHETDHTLLTAPRRDGPNEGLVKLRGVRLATTIETAEDDWLNETIMKQLTGGDLITGHGKHEKLQTFKPTHTLFMVTNHLPRVKSQGFAVWRRVRAIPFTVRIADEKKDPQLMDKLKAERAGILAWLIQGCRNWLETGLTEPPEVIEATEAYKNNQDALAAFIENCCEIGGETQASRFRAAYESWCADNKIDKPLNRDEFPLRVTERFRQTKKKGLSFWIGVTLKPQLNEKVSEFAPPAEVASKETATRWSDLF